jgi:iron complex transport system permease protein
LGSAGGSALSVDFVTSPDAPISREELVRAVRRYIARRLILTGAGLALLLLVMLISVGAGVGAMSIGKTARALLAPVLPADWTTDISPLQVTVLYNLRFPRTVMAVVGGASLAVAGVAMQGITRNPLVSPYTVGISPAAAFGASLAILFGFGGTTGSGPYWIVAGAFASAIACAAVVLSFSALRGVTSTMLILGGVALTYLFAALTATVQFVATEQQLAMIVQWTFGSLNGVTWNEVCIDLAMFLAMLPVFIAHAPALNAFAAGGDEMAAALGFHVGRTRVLVTIAAVLITAAVVSFVGVIGFVGLVAPHIARMVIGGDNRVLLPFAGVVGALLLLAADLIGRLAFAPVIIPVGIVVAYIGVPIFLQLMLSRRAELEN